jgi:hypothetical protein
VGPHHEIGGIPGDRLQESDGTKRPRIDVELARDRLIRDVDLRFRLIGGTQVRLEFGVP